MKIYAVRQKSTGLFIPRLPQGHVRGGSRLEPSSERSPRIFYSKQSARSFLGNWLRGIIEAGYSVDFEDGGESACTVTKQPHRNKDDMEIVEFDCIEVVQP